MHSIFESRMFRTGAGARGLLTEEEFQYGSLDPSQQDELFANFKDSYERSVGSAHDRNWFDSRAGWTFWGSIDGGIAARMQHPEIDDGNGGRKRVGIWKLNASYGKNGSFKDTLRGGKEFIEKHGKEPAWAVLTPKLADYVVRVSKGDFIIAPPDLVKALYPKLTDANQRGGGYFARQVSCDKDGRLWAKTPNGQDLEKVCVVNNAYLDLFPDYRSFIDAAIKTGSIQKAAEEELAKDLAFFVQSGMAKSVNDKIDATVGRLDKDVEVAKKVWFEIPQNLRSEIKGFATELWNRQDPQTQEELKQKYSDLSVLWKMLHDENYVEPPPVRANPDGETLHDDRTGQPSLPGTPPGPDERGL